MKCPYLISNTSLSLRQARNKCANNNMTLLTDLTPVHINSIRNDCMNQNDINKFWVGLIDSERCSNNNSNRGLRWYYNQTCVDEDNFFIRDHLLIQRESCNRGIAIRLDIDKEYNRAECLQSAGYICQKFTMNQVENSYIDSVKSNYSSNLAETTSKYQATDFSSEMSTISVRQYQYRSHETTNFPTNSNNSDHVSMAEIAAIAAGVAIFFLILIIAIACKRYRCKKQDQLKTKTNNLKEKKVVKLSAAELQDHIQIHFKGIDERSNDALFKQSTKSSAYILPSTVPPYVNGCFIKKESNKPTSKVEDDYENTRSECNYFELFEKEADYENQPKSILPYASTGSLNNIYENTGNDVVEIVYDNVYMQQT